MLVVVHAVIVEHSIVTTVVVAEVAITAAEVLVTVWLVIVERL